MAKKKQVNWLAIAGIAVASVLAVGGLVALFSADKTEKLNSFDYEVAAVDSEGKVYEAETALVSGYISVNELTIKYSDEAETTYKVHFYDGDKAYVTSTAALKDDYEYEAGEGSTIVYARVEIVPIEDEDGVIDFWEQAGYADDLTVEYNSELVEIEEATDEEAAA